MINATQNGAALIVSLIILVIVTLLGVSAIRSSLLEEKMAAHSYDRNLAFQAAETALRIGEAYVEANKPIPSYDDTDDSCPADFAAINNCNNGVCPPPDKDCESRWEVTEFNGWIDAEVSLTLTSNAPQYFIEYLGNTFPCSDGSPSDPMNCKRYRITARSSPGQGRATVILQSVFATD